MTATHLQAPATVAANQTVIRPLGKARWRRVHALAGIGWVTSALAATLYLADNGLSDFTSLSDAMIAIGIMSGLVATNALLFMLLLSARVPVIDNVIGQVRATQWHKTLGEVLVYGLFAHMAFLLVGTGLALNASVVTVFLDWWGLSDFIWAVVAIGLFAVVTFTSITAARRKASYEVWYAIHLLSYVAVAASIPHMFSIGSLFSEGTWQRTYWITALVAVGVCIVAFRFVLPVYRTLRYSLRLSNVTRVSADSYNLVFTGRNLATLRAKGGQYLNWRLLTKGLWGQSHPMSLSAAPDGRTLRVTVKVIGDGTSKIVHAPLGTRAMIEGPYGVFTDAARTRDAQILIGAGSGIAPIRALLEASTALPSRTVVFLRASLQDDLILLDEFDRICRQRGITLFVLVGPRAKDHWMPTMYANQTLASLVPFASDADIFVCGSPGFIDAVQADARAAGVKNEQFHEERFSW